MRAQLLEAVRWQGVRALCYTRGRRDILMSGYKFAAAKLAASAALGMTGPHAGNPGSLTLVRAPIRLLPGPLTHTTEECGCVPALQVPARMRVHAEEAMQYTSACRRLPSRCASCWGAAMPARASSQRLRSPT